MFVPVLCLVLFQLANHGDAVCTPYQSSCTFLTAETCCGFPMKTLCLPDNRGGMSCLSPFDVENINPALTALNPFAPALGQVESSERQFVQQALNPASDPLANPLLDPLANPFLDPLANPILDPLANPMINPLLSQG